MGKTWEIFKGVIINFSWKGEGMELILLELLYNVEYLAQVASTGFWWIHEVCCYEPVKAIPFDTELGATGCVNLDGLF